MEERTAETALWKRRKRRRRKRKMMREISCHSLKRRGEEGGGRGKGCISISERWLMRKSCFKWGCVSKRGGGRLRLLPKGERSGFPESKRGGIHRLALSR